MASTLAFTNGNFVAAGYIVALGAIAAYSARLLVRGRSLSKQVPPEDRRWM